MAGVRAYTLHINGQPAACGDILEGKELKEVKPSYRTLREWEKTRVPGISCIHWDRCFWERKLPKETTAESVTNGSLVEDILGTQGNPAATLMAAACPLLWVVQSSLRSHSPA